MDMDDIELPSSQEVRGWYELVWEILKLFKSPQAKDRDARFGAISKIYAGVQNIHVDYVHMFTNFVEAVPKQNTDGFSYSGYIDGEYFDRISQNEVPAAIESARENFAKARREHVIDRRNLRFNAEAYLKSAIDDEELRFLFMVINYFVYQYQEHYSYAFTGRIGEQRYSDIMAKVVVDSGAKSTLDSYSTHFLDEIRKINDPEELERFSKEAVDSINRRYFDVVDAYIHLQRKWKKQ